ncbi:ribosome modulation factor [Pseudomonas sp. NCHU5208]|uniref:ribosome modulation factor n=1 Tax=unclassified Pseudomonas TaxID=196821 RepID=UPI003F9C9F02
MPRNSTCTDNRRFNNPHAAIFEAGRKAAISGLPVHSCPYSHHPLKASWLRGYSAGKQMPLLI